MNLETRVYHLLQPATDDQSRASRLVDLFIIGLIVVSLVMIVLESEPSIRSLAPGLFHGSELIIAVLFLVEYVARVWSIPVEPRYAHPVWGRLRFIMTPMAIIDLLAFAPSLFLGGLVDLRMLRLLRLVRLTRLLKLARYSNAAQHIQRALMRSREELTLSVLLVLILMLIASSLIYAVEHDVQPQWFGTIPRAMWWSVITLTTVGYGDVYPVTVLGRVLAAGIAVLGVGMVALPTGIIGAGFIEEIRRQREDGRRCPHCGEAIEAEDDDD
ncbi:MAG: ion transporter [Deltaproteobacteria bacterium]|nr:ion transporter [Deltaproteobacteria bacterium]